VYNTFQCDVSGFITFTILSRCSLEIQMKKKVMPALVVLALVAVIGGNMARSSSEERAKVQNESEWFKAEILRRVDANKEKSMKSARWLSAPYEATLKNPPPTSVTHYSVMRERDVITLAVEKQLEKGGFIPRIERQEYVERYTPVALITDMARIVLEQEQLARDEYTMLEQVTNARKRSEQLDIELEIVFIKAITWGNKLPRLIFAPTE